MDQSPSQARRSPFEEVTMAGPGSPRSPRRGDFVSLRRTGGFGGGAGSEAGQSTMPAVASHLPAVRGLMAIRPPLPHEDQENRVPGVPPLPDRLILPVHPRPLRMRDEPGTLHREVALSPAEVLLDQIESNPYNQRPGRVYEEICYNLNRGNVGVVPMVRAIVQDRLRNRRGTGLSVTVDNGLQLIPEDVPSYKSYLSFYNLHEDSDPRELFPSWNELWDKMEEARRISYFATRPPIYLDRPRQSEDEVDGDSAELERALSKSGRPNPEVSKYLYPFSGYVKRWDEEDRDYYDDVECIMQEIVSGKPTQVVRRREQLLSNKTNCSKCLSVQYNLKKEVRKHPSVKKLPSVENISVYSRASPPPELLQEIRDMMTDGKLPIPNLQEFPYDTRKFKEEILLKDGTRQLIDVELELEVLFKAYKVDEMKKTVEIICNAGPNGYIKSAKTSADGVIYLHLPGRDIQKDKQATVALLKDTSKVKGLMLNSSGVDFYRLVNLAVQQGTAALQRNSLARECRAAETPHPVLAEITERIHKENHYSPDKMFAWYKEMFPPRYLPQVSYLLLMSWAGWLNCKTCTQRDPKLAAEGYWFFYKYLLVAQRTDKAMVLAMLQWEEGKEKPLMDNDKDLQFHNELNKLVQNVRDFHVKDHMAPSDEHCQPGKNTGDSSVHKSVAD